VPDLSTEANALVGWLSANGIALAIVAVVAMVLYRWARPAVHRSLMALGQAQSVTLGDDGARQVEIEKRVATLEDLIAKVLRALVVLAIVVVIFGAFDLWPMLAGLGVIVAAITLAGQAIVLDYLMGVLILIEGEYFKGDIIRVGAVEGTVEEVGLRRTVVRDPRGTLHSISNGLIRDVANLTRSYAMAMVHIDGIADGDVERAIHALDAAGRAIAEDPDLAGAFIEIPHYTGTTKLSAYGATLRLSGRVQPEQRIKIEAELRRRVAAELAASGIVPIRPAAPPAVPAGTERTR
jgi:moderate conductance mechanosensitive channel